MLFNIIITFLKLLQLFSVIVYTMNLISEYCGSRTHKVGISIVNFPSVKSLNMDILLCLFEIRLFMPYNRDAVVTNLKKGKDHLKNINIIRVFLRSPNICVSICLKLNFVNQNPNIVCYTMETEKVWIVFFF